MEADPMGTHEPGGHAMASFKKVVLILRLREAVFESLATLEHIPRWTPTLQEDGGGERATSARARADTRRRRDRSDPYRGRPFEITGYDPPRRLMLAGQIGLFEAVVDYSLDELALGTLVTCRVQVDLTNLVLKGDVRLATSRIEAGVSRSLDRSKQLLETQDAS
jgi:uncharacterized protein YndB with AHSA1/START domain